MKKYIITILVIFIIGYLFIRITKHTRLISYPVANPDNTIPRDTTYKPIYPWYLML